MVYMKNIKRSGHLVSFDGYINGCEDRHFTMTVDLNDISKSQASIEKGYHTGVAAIKICRTLAAKGYLPEELVFMSH